MKKVFYFICLVFSVFVFDVSASNNVNYSIEITKNYDFKEVIDYSITNYKQLNNGYNYFSTIVNDDIYTDIFYNTKYKKHKSKNGNTYNVKLSHTYNEYTMSNANFLNNCFEKSSYDYDMDKIKFYGRGGFLCLRGDSLTINLNTDFSISDTNATKNGNIYTWFPNDENFEMYFTLYKTYPESTPKKYDDAGVIHASDGKEETVDPNNDNTDTKDTTDTEEDTSSNTGTIIAIIFVGASIIFIIALIILKNKKNNLNRI